MFFGKKRKILVQYKRIRREIKNIKRKKFTSDPVFDDKYLKTKIKYKIIK